MTTARDVLRQPAVRRYLAFTVLGAVGLNLMVTVLFKQTFDITGDELDIGWLGSPSSSPPCCWCSSAGGWPTASTAAG